MVPSTNMPTAMLPTQVIHVAGGTSIHGEAND
jgi:hypothetical protein